MHPAPSSVVVLSRQRAATITDLVGTAACCLKPRWSHHDMAIDGVGGFGGFGGFGGVGGWDRWAELN